MAGEHLLPSQRTTAHSTRGPPRAVSPVTARYRLGIIYNNEHDCVSPDTAFGIGGDCYVGVRDTATSAIERSLPPRPRPSCTSTHSNVKLASVTASQHFPLFICRES